MSENNSGTPGAISTKLGRILYVLYIFRREDGVRGREFG
jgi:hypothetical protein